MSALSINDAIAAHHKAWHAVFTAAPGRPLRSAMEASIEALDVLLGTPAGTHQGAKDLLAYLRWWLDEVGPFSSEHGDYPPPYFIVQARVADLAMLLFEPPAGDRPQ
ncbi:hypothetical protein Q8W71_17540 [Methylobacterium sp. NEAU 140]|uniref:hypothetical protein n=1 Tax=Methylobacterium sp. NEAU 140 TaxID=3064945 RepID=UPI0027346CF7|nr:hypothetical protein [Methylobacterium sp. NEAU 140]MDP4024431.1 hypothetical protein [Methylobacterium sp. NEAU 140]